MLPDTTDIEPIFEEDTSPVTNIAKEDQLLLTLDGFDGPIDLLLALSRDQKLDITKISILELANQYIDFIEKARELRLELAADYLVMAAWLAYLKSRLLLPVEEGADEPSGAELAEALAFQLRRLEAMRGIADRLMALPQLGVDVFARGAPEGLRTISKSIHEADIYDLLSAYGDIQRRQEYATYKVEPFNLLSIDDALERITTMLGKIPGEWMKIQTLLPHGSKGYESKLIARSAIAATFGASLEMAKRGEIEIKQDDLFGQIYIRKPKHDRRRKGDAA